ncbi:MAG: helix-turn-helix domain-containing protein [Enterocloster clostridioformis]|nr:helix-turn-helix domain-containing protein [Enterocloster clostridioformis]
MNQNQRNGAPVLARNCEIRCASFISGDIPRNHSPPGFLEFSFSKFQEIGGCSMYYDPKESGKRIQTMRNSMGLTQEQLAERLNIATSTLGNIERGSKGISMDLAVEISIVLDVSLDYLVLGRKRKTLSPKEVVYQIIDLLTELLKSL